MQHEEDKSDLPSLDPRFRTVRRDTETGMFILYCPSGQIGCCRLPTEPAEKEALARADGHFTRIDRWSSCRSGPIPKTPAESSGMRGGACASPPSARSTWVRWWSMNLLP